MKTRIFEQMLGGPQAAHLSRDALIGLNSLGRHFEKNVSEDELFETAVRKADERQLRQLARLRIEATYGHGVN